MAARRTANQRRAALNRYARSVGRGRSSTRAAAEWAAREERRYRQGDIANDFAMALNIGVGPNGGAYFDSGVSAAFALGLCDEIGLSFWYNRNGETWTGAFGGILGASSDYNTWGDGFGCNMEGNDTLAFWADDYADATRMTIPVDSLWHHVAFTWTAAGGGSYTGWLDGVEQVLTGGTPPSSAFTPAGTMRIGAIGDANFDTNGAFFAGHIDELAIYQKTLNQDLVDAMYNDGIPHNLVGTDCGCFVVGYWRMGDNAVDDATEDTGLMFDLSPHGYHMTPRVAGARVGTAAFTEDTP